MAKSDMYRDGEGAFRVINNGEDLNPYDRFYNPRPRLPYRARHRRQVIEYEDRRPVYDVPRFVERVPKPVYKVTVTYADLRPIAIEQPYMARTEPEFEEIRDRYAVQELPYTTSYMPSRKTSYDDEFLLADPYFQREDSGEPVTAKEFPGYLFRSGHYEAIALGQKSGFLSGQNQFRRSHQAQRKREHIDHVLYHGNNRFTEIYEDSRTGGITTLVYR